MIETKFTLRPTYSGNANSTQSCTLEIESTFPDGLYRNAEMPIEANFNTNDKTINVEIHILDGDSATLPNKVIFDGFPIAKATWHVNLKYHHKNKDKPPKVKSKTVQMDINIEPKPIEPFAIR